MVASAITKRRLCPVAKLEKEIERQLVAMVSRHDGRCLKWVCPGWSGVPDRLVLIPGGHIYFVELKRPKGGRLSAMQRKWRDWLMRLGFMYCVIWSEDDVRIFETLIRLETGGER
jgi:hypothetical protein